MAESKHVTEEQLEAALRKNAGVLSLAAEQLGCTRQNVHIRVGNSAHLQAVIADIKERTLDIAEGQIVKAMQKGDMATVRWYAERQGKSRGYGNSTELSFSRELVDRLIEGVGGDLGKLRELRAELEG